MASSTDPQAPSLRLSVLDQSPIREGGTASQALAETIELAKLADALGYERYWLAEHHDASGLAGSAPEILIGRIAGATAGVRVGSGGVMLTHYSPFKVAESFRMLEALYPGRIDLGIGRAPGSDQRTALALNAGGGSGAETYPRQVAELIAYLGPGLAPGHPFAGITAMPAIDTAPEVWLLGSTGDSAAIAAYFGQAFSFAHFINDRDAEAVLQGYRRAFRPTKAHGTPRGNVAVFVLCADTESEALRLAKSRDLWRLRLDQGAISPVPSVETAENYPYSPAEIARIERNRRRYVVGDPEQVRTRLGAIARGCGVDEIVAVSICYDFSARLRSYRLLAEAFALEPRGPIPEAAPSPARSSPISRSA